MLVYVGCDEAVAFMEGIKDKVSSRISLILL